MRLRKSGEVHAAHLLSLSLVWLTTASATAPPTVAQALRSYGVKI